jgi:parallel beta helix pectate lyase-like protein
MLTRLSTALAAFTLATAAGAATISGTLFDDARAYATRTDFRPQGDATVMLYRDGGDRRPDGADDHLVSTLPADGHGNFAFPSVENGLYWVAVDSTTVGTHQGAWMEQTYGPAGALCDNGRGGATILVAAGPCYAGRFGAQSDDARQLATAKHVAEIPVAGADVQHVDFAFSGNVVTNVKDGAHVQGSLRQFVINANALPGPNAMRFVPVGNVPAGDHWIVRLASALPPLRDGETAIDGTLFSFLTGRAVGMGGYDVRPHTDDTRPPRPHIDLEVVATGENGLSFEAPGAVRVIEIAGARTAIRAAADLSVERSEISGAADPNDTASAENGIVITGGTAALQDVIIFDRARNGISVEGTALLEMIDSEVTRCGSTSASAIALHSSSASVRRCTVTNNRGIGIEVDGRGNAIRASHIVDNSIGIVLRPRATDSLIEFNDIVWNHAGAIVGEANGGPAKRNRITTNHFNENGGAVIGVGVPPEESAATTCDANVLGTVGTPRVETTSTTGTEGNGQITVDGMTCPNASVEIYTSYVTSELRKHIQENAQDLSSVREALKRNSVESRDDAGLTRLRLPSVGEFNFAGTAVADATGHFHAVVSWPRQLSHAGSGIDLGGGALSVATIAIDPTGNTSHFSRRKLVNTY